jgi:glutamine---fructose-6-phosphate transaminase (isomerizing)
LNKDEVKVFNIYGVEVKKDIFRVNWDVASAEKSGYEHFMMKEMCEEPKVIKDTINPRIVDGRILLDKIKIQAEDLKNIDKIYIVACGTAFHAGVVGKYVIEKLAKIPVEVMWLLNSGIEIRSLQTEIL